jgi:putative transposase
LTHRCHDRQFLLRFAKDRDGYRHRLREAVRSVNASLLTYNIICNHVHLLTYVDAPEQIAELMQQSAGEFARDYNRRRGRSGAFWKGRYHATMVATGEYLWECLRYVELNMVRCGVVKHPAEWSWSGYGERMGWRKRNRLLDQEKLLWLLRCEDADAFRKQLNWLLEDPIIHDQLRRQPKWSEAIAVGDRAYVDAIEQQIRGRQRLRVEEEDGSWTLQESYEAFSEVEKRPIGPLAGSIPL